VFERGDFVVRDDDISRYLGILPRVRRDHLLQQGGGLLFSAQAATSLYPQENIYI
jgi:hypothetical protein